MSEKLSELEKYVCDQCATTQCLSPTRKTFSKEGKNNEGDLIILDFDIYHCCRDNNASSYCAFCEGMTKVKKKVPIIQMDLKKESAKIKEIMRKAVKVPSKGLTELQKKKEALMKQLREVEEAEKKPE